MVELLLDWYRSCWILILLPPEFGHEAAHTWTVVLINLLQVD